MIYAHVTITKGIREVFIVRKFIHGLGTFLMFAGLFGCVCMIGAFFMSLKPPIEDFCNTLLATVVIVPIFALISIFGDDLRCWTEGKPGFLKQLRIKRGIKRKWRKLNKDQQ